MAGSVTISPSSVSVVPGEQTTATVRIRNTGAVVDQFSVSVLGQPSVWTTAVPAVLSLFPGADGSIELHFAPPRSADVGNGAVPFGVRVDASQDPDGSVVEEGEITLLPFLDVQAKLTPRTSEAKKTARHEVLVDNRGNSPIEAEIVASDPDEVLAFDVKPRTVAVPGGQSVHVPIKVVALKGFLKGTDKHRPFQVRVSYSPTHPPITLDGTLLQKPGMPKFILPLVGAAVVLALAALVLPAMKKDGASGKLSLTSEEAATTTTAATEEAPAEEPVDANAPATAEEAAAAAAAEAAANGKDPDAPAGGDEPTVGGGGGTQTASSGGGSAPAPAPTTTALVEESTSDTSPPAAPTNPPPATQQYQKFVGTWTATASGATPAKFTITTSGTELRIDLPTASVTTQADADDGTIVFTTTSPQERHSMTFNSSGQLVDLITSSVNPQSNRTLTYTR